MKLLGRIFQDGNFWLAAIPSIDAMTQGYSREEAAENAKDLVENFVNDITFKATIDLKDDDTFAITGSDPQKLRKLFDKRSTNLPMYRKIHITLETQDCDMLTPKEIGMLHTIIQNEVWGFLPKGPQIRTSMIAIPQFMLVKEKG